MNETTKNFWEAWNSHVWEDPLPVFYRLYHRDDGTPICYTMEDLPGTYIEIDRETYLHSRFNVRVVDCKIIQIKQPTQVSKLQPSDTGTACDPCDVCVVVTADQPHTYWSTQAHEIN